MLKNQIINLKVIEKVALALGEINEEVVYVGGAVVSLYVTDEGAEQPRPTKDIDISVQISSYSQMEELREKLASKKIYPAIGENVLYRYRFEDVLIDFIPYESTSLGPTNSWLKPGFENNITVTIGEVYIKILPVSLYLASKWEAFKSRGNDPRTSHDFEDIIYVLDNNKDVDQDIENSDESVQSFLSGMSKEILEHSSTYEIIECHINPFTREERRNIVLSKLQKLFKKNGI